MQYKQKTSRRGFLDWLIGLCSAISGAAMTIPSLMYLWPAAQGGESSNVEVPGAENLSVGTSTKVQVGPRAVIVVRGRDGYVAFSAVCTHLGCLVRWDPGKKQFLCPCHAAAFDDKGQVVSGPPPGPLEPYKVKEVSGKVFVSSI